MKKDIENRKDIEQLVNNFYHKVKHDDLIGHFFTTTFKINWEHHLPVMYDFWENAIFFSGTYTGNPLDMHQRINMRFRLTMEDFHRWNKLFIETVDSLFEGQNASLAKDRAISISTVMQLKILKDN